MNKGINKTRNVKAMVPVPVKIKSEAKIELALKMPPNLKPKGKRAK